MAGSAALFWLVILTVRCRLSQPGWTGIAVGVLLLLLIGAWAWPHHNGWVAMAIWTVLVILPSLGARLLERLILAERYRAGAVLARGIALLHPLDGWRDFSRKVNLLAQARSGDATEVRAKLEDAAGRGENLDRFRTMEILRAECRWAEGRRWVEETIPERDLARDPNLRLFYLRALGEVGDIEAMLSAHARTAGPLETARTRALGHLYVAAFSGRAGLVERILEGPLASMSPALRAFWMGTALQAAGDGASRSILEDLARSARGPTREAATWRLTEPVRAVSTDALSPAACAALDGFDKEVRMELLYSRDGAGRIRLVTTALIALNGIVYWIELARGPENQENLVRLGALVVPTDRVAGEWWRIFTAGFLHFGPVHLTMNLLGLWIIGGYVERCWGRARLLVGYFAATFGSCLATLVILDGLAERPTIMVGASGGILGLLGVGLAAVLVGWRRQRAAALKRQLIVFSLMVALQVVFDHFTPMVSSTAHLSGLAIGFAIGLPFALAGSKEGAGDLRPGAPSSGRIS